MSVDSIDSKVILVTGACGTIGSAIVKRCIEQSADRIICFDRDDIGLFMLRKKYDTGRIELAITQVGRHASHLWRLSPQTKQTSSRKTNLSK